MSTWRKALASITITIETLRRLHRAIAGIWEDYATLRMNTAIAKLIELNNQVTKAHPEGAPRAVVEPMVLLLAPVAPHIAEELWSRLGNDKPRVHGDQSLAHGPMPEADQRYLLEDTVEYPIQINGKVRSRVVVPTRRVRTKCVPQRWRRCAPPRWSAVRSPAR